MAGDISSIYKEKVWGKAENGENITDGFVFRGKRTFRRAREGLGEKMKKGFKDEKNGVNYRVLDRRIKGVELEIEMEVIHKNEKGVAMLKLYGPNKRKENVVSVTRSKGNDYKFVVVLAENVIKPLMNEYLNEDIQIKKTDNSSEVYKCPFCDKTSHSKPGLKGHITRMHKNIALGKTENEINDDKFSSEESDDSTIYCSENDTTLEETSVEKDGNKNYKKKCDSCDYEVRATRKYKVVQQILEHKICHTKKSSDNCVECDFITKNTSDMKRHMRDKHGSKSCSTSPPAKKKRSKEEDDEKENEKETNDIKDLSFRIEDMEIESYEEQNLDEISKLQDEKIREKEKNNDAKEKLYRQRVEEEERKKEEELKMNKEKLRVEKKQVKQKLKKEKRKESKIKEHTIEKQNKFDNIKEVPENCKNLVNKNDVVYVVPGDGRCGQNSTAALLFHDEKFGLGLKRKSNLFFAEHWYKKYQYKSQCSVDSPYKRQFQGKDIEFKDPEELIKFLKYDPRAMETWSDSEDLVVLSDMYQMRIKIITTKGENDTNPIINWIYPDPNLKQFAELNIEMEDMVLLHQDDHHFNLIISGDSDLAKLGSLSNRANGVKDIGEVNDKDLEKLKVELENCLKKQSYIEKEYFDCEKELRKMTEEVEKLRVENNDLRMILKLKDELKKNEDSDDKVSLMDVDEDKTKIDEDIMELYALKKRGFKRRNPQTESIEIKIKESDNPKTIYSCSECGFKSSSSCELKKHKVFKHVQEQCSDSKMCDNKNSSKENVRTHDTKHTDREDTNHCPESKSNTPTKYGIETPIQSKHNELERDQEEEEYNCDDCPFQGTSESQLKKHIDLTHVIKCRICNEPFTDKRNLMNHRKIKHVSSVAPCRKFLSGDCSRTSEACWWSHGKIENDAQSINCFICGKTFKAKTELMSHRKQDHASHVEPCHKFSRGECPFQDKFCWFKHGSKIIENTENKTNADDLEKYENMSVFQEATKPAKPPIMSEIKSN